MWIAGMGPARPHDREPFRERAHPAPCSIRLRAGGGAFGNTRLVTLNTYFLDGTKVEAAANKRTFTWKRATENHQAKLRCENPMPTWTRSIA